MAADEEASEVTTEPATVDAMLLTKTAIEHSGPLIWALLFSVVLIWYRTEVRTLLGKMSGVKAAGLEFSFAQEAMAKAAKGATAQNTVIDSTVKKAVDITERDKERALDRAERRRDLLAGKRILWVDDLVTNNRRERDVLEAFGMKIEQASTNAEATAALSADRSSYDLIISDIDRPDNRQAGVELLEWVRAKYAALPLIFYVTQLDADLPMPLGAFGITNRPDVLLHLVIDALERRA